LPLPVATDAARAVASGGMAPAVVWLVAAPNRRPPATLSTGAAATSSYEALKEVLATGGGVWAQVFRMHLPMLRVGTLDSLIAASDALARDEKTVDGVVDRLLRQARELQEDEVRGTVAEWERGQRVGGRSA